MSEEAMVEASAVVTVEEARSVAGKYLTFVLANETYGLEILKVREIIGMMAVTSVPNSPRYIKGVINLRGKVIPVVDLRLKFSMDEAEHTEETCIIVVCVEDAEMGIIVDKVSEVMDIREENIEPPPDFGSKVELDKGFILGMGKAAEKVIILLDIVSVLASS